MQVVIKKSDKSILAIHGDDQSLAPGAYQGFGDYVVLRVDDGAVTILDGAFVHDLDLADLIDKA